jgi:hypothetical protein
MEYTEYQAKLDELDHLFNDDDAPHEPSRLWLLLAELLQYDMRARPAAAE